ncbi:MAG: sterol desaturase family protein [Bryobacteraceae bacterium]|nr:sterol desaturase family protein [Bryobacteraceae bacterium]MDW8376836.1 sterol desaturase family protein [Bryobacterales bacterium]
MWEFLSSSFAALHAWVFETLVQPVLYRAGLMAWAEQAFEGTELFLIGALELVILWALFRPLEQIAPAEPWADRKAANRDFVYALLAKLGVFPLFFFFILTPAVDWVNANLRLAGVIPPNLEDLVPPLQTAPVVSALLYLLILDFADYWRHRWQHRFRIWWALHAVHHSQRQMTFWTDDREHLLDQMISALFRAVIGLALGVPPVQFLTVTLVSGALEALSHANVRLSFGPLGDRILVSPRFHRTHHAMDQGRYGSNFAQVFAFWDVIFGTANFDPTYRPTGIADQLRGRDYGEGFWAQQWLGLRRMFEN